MNLIAGVDEVGRGPLAGPVVAAAVILDPSYDIEGLADSKKHLPVSPVNYLVSICTDPISAGFCGPKIGSM